MSGLASALAVASALGCGLMAGVFFAFSSFVLGALARLAPEEGIRAMQAINVGAVRSVFLVAFLGTAVLCAVSAGISLGSQPRPAAYWALTGAGLYLGGGFLVTMFFNVPLNNALAVLVPSSPEAAAQWADYVARWGMWNHVRTAACLAASGLFVIQARILI